jgi:Ca2+-transporting ATPase
VLVPILLLGTYAVHFVELAVYQAPFVVAQSAAFATLIVMELFHTFNARRLHTTVFDEGFLNNKAVFASITVSALFLVAATHTEIGNTFLETAPLDTTTWILIIAMSSAVLFVNELIKLLIKSEFDEQERLHGDATLE